MAYTCSVRGASVFHPKKQSNANIFHLHKLLRSVTHARLVVKVMSYANRHITVFHYT